MLAGTADMKEGIDMAAEDEATPGRGFSSSSLSDPLSLLLELKIKKIFFSSALEMEGVPIRQLRFFADPTFRKPDVTTTATVQQTF